MAAADREVDVLVVGAGLGGLATTMFLARLGVRVLMAEKHPTTSIHPRAIGQNPRTMELLRLAGIAEGVQQVTDHRGAKGHFTTRVAETVRGEVLGTFEEGFDHLVATTAPCSPMPWALAWQDQLEPLMRARSLQDGALIRFGTALVSYEQDAHGVTAVLRDRRSDAETTVRARYLVAADGDRSPVREGLGIARHGHGSLSHVVGTIFDADLSKVLPPDASGLYYLRNPHFSGIFIGSDRPERHTFLVEYDPERGESADDFTPDRCVELIRIGLDAPDLEPHVLDIQRWEMAARIAERWRAGRVFLVGDSAKVVPPTGGLGGNTAIGDGYDLAWKLSAVLTGQAGPGLLDSYEPERRLVAQLVMDESMHLYASRLAPHLQNRMAEPVGYAEVILGFRYRSDAVVIDDDTSRVESPARPTGRPGFRMPHVWVRRAGERISTVDLFGSGWLLMTGEDGAGWTEWALSASNELGVPIEVHGLATDLRDPDGELAERFGIGTRGASLIRPDGVVAWRTATRPDDPAATLRDVLAQVLSR
ncbi:aklavinone 12-hydroxylase RdmE [Streptomyces halobius]|uniref:FAD-dependent monooxygenase n=1 Tax=Streptomyces halobius TaxID=2879846 RepID=A0ABY4MI82_9ACTN|nr:FAD-dependent monooxygenase [Streptomyces halobius]UQA97350.1 FAD-dependent monooxygenase [Streptomyces halobius]